MKKNTKFLLSATLFALLSACGGGGGDGGGSTATTPATTSTSTSSVLSGTAATGAALANATITVKDSKGASKTVTADADGKFSVDVTGMTAPFIVQAISQDGSKTFYAIAQTVPASNVINVTSITDSLAQASGQTPSAVFADPVSTFASVDFAKVATAQNNLKAALANYMQTLGIASGVDLTTTAFAADNSKVDALLDCLKPASGGVLSVKAACTGGSDVQAFDPATNVASAPAVLAVPAVATLDYNKTNLPLINAQIKKLSDAYSGSSGDLSTVLAALIDDNSTQDNLNKTAFIAREVASYASGTRITFYPGALVGVDSASNTVDMCSYDTVTENGATKKEITAFTFKKSSAGVWQVTTESAAAKAACKSSSSNSSAMQATVKAVSKYNATGPKTPGLLATVVPSSYFLCIGTGTTHIANGGLITSSEKCGTAGTGGTLTSTFDVSSWKPSTGAIPLYAYFVDDYTTAGKKTVINWSGDMTLDSTGKLNFNSIDVCAGRYDETARNCGRLADGVSGVQ